MLNFDQSITSDSDLDPLRQILARLEGQECWRTSFTTGVLSLDFGTPRPLPIPSDPGLTTGAWSLSVWSENWTLVPDRSQATRIDPWVDRNIDDRLEAASGLLDSASLEYPSRMVLTFATNSELIIDHDARMANDDPDASDWKLFMPDGRVVVFRAHRSWEIKDQGA